MMMWKVTNTGVYEKIVIKVSGEAVFYIRTKKVEGRIKRQKEHRHTHFHDWLYTEKEAMRVYEQRTGRVYE